MADICSAAQAKEKELGRHITPSARQRIAKLDPETQVKWVVNPGMESYMQRVENEIIAALRCQECESSDSNSSNSNSNSTKSNSTTSTPTKKPVPTPEPEEDEDIYACSLFD